MNDEMFIGNCILSLIQFKFNLLCKNRMLMQFKPTFNIVAHDGVTGSKTYENFSNNSALNSTDKRNVRMESERKYTQRAAEDFEHIINDRSKQLNKKYSTKYIL